MRSCLLASVLIACLVVVVPAGAADDLIERLATCQDSWLDWKDNPVQMKKLVDSFDSVFAKKQGESFFVAKKPTLVIGLPVVQAFPENVGMGVGFSVVVDATFEKTRASLEKAVGKPLGHCETSDGMRMCELEVAEKRTLMLMTGDSPTSKTTMIGCYYYYEK